MALGAVQTFKSVFMKLIGADKGLRGAFSGFMETSAALKSPRTL